MKVSNPLILILTTLIFTACGQPGLDFNQKSHQSSSGNFQLDAPGCHPIDRPNIVPILDTTNDGSRHYSTCFDSAAPSQVRVIGHSTRNTWVCAYPIVTTSLTAFKPVKDAQGLPVSQCWDARAAGASGQLINFYFTGFNGLIVVDYHQRLDMSRCLANGQTCPNDFSVGSI
jgi:hypothetical protein